MLVAKCFRAVSTFDTGKAGAKKKRTPGIRKFVKINTNAFWSQKVLRMMVQVATFEPSVFESFTEDRCLELEVDEGLQLEIVLPSPNRDFFVVLCRL